MSAALFMWRFCAKHRTASRATPGLYYVVEAGSEVNGITPASCMLATSTETTLNIPNKGTKGFYKIRVSVTPVVVQE